MQIKIEITISLNDEAMIEHATNTNTVIGWVTSPIHDLLEDAIGHLADTIAIHTHTTKGK